MSQGAFSFLLFQGSLEVFTLLFESVEQKHGFYNRTCLNQKPSLAGVVALDFKYFLNPTWGIVLCRPEENSLPDKGLAVSST